MKVLFFIKNNFRLIFTGLAVAVLLFFMVNVFLMGREVAKYVNITRPKFPPGVSYDFLLNKNSKIKMQFDTSFFLDDKRVLCTYNMPSVQKKLIILKLDDSLHLLPRHVLIHKNANVYGGFWEHKVYDRAISISLKHFDLGNDLYIKYDGSPVKIKAAMPNRFIFKSSALTSLSVHFNHDQQAACKLTTERYFRKYALEFALIRKENKNFIALLLSKDDQDDNDTVFLDGILKT